MKLNKQVCSLELSKKLKELGIKQVSLYKWCWIESEEMSPIWRVQQVLDIINQLENK
jgi:hypothetical protein